MNCFDILLQEIHRLLWGPGMMILLLVLGLLYTVRTRFFQFRAFGSLKVLFQKTAGDAKGIPPTHALATALAGTLGTGNLVGVATAMIAGGPGAIFWMWISALIGMIIKYAEIVLAVRFRQKNSQGEWCGGPMYTIENGLGKRWRWLAQLFALSAILASFGIGNMTQVNAASTNLESALGIPAWIFGIGIAIFTAVVIVGGIRRIGKLTAKVVPFMAGLYIVGALLILLRFHDQIPSAFRLIFASAFQPSSALGGAAGFTVLMAMRYGLARGISSNEAGMGSAPIAHAATEVKDPVQQGLLGIVEVFVDTLLMCTLTALALLVSGVWQQDFTGASMTAGAFAAAFGPGLGNTIVTVIIVFLALSTLISWSYYGERCTEYLLGHRAIPLYRILFIGCILLGSVLSLQRIWLLADIFNSLMILPNVVALWALSSKVVDLTRSWTARRKEKRT